MSLFRPSVGVLDEMTAFGGARVSPCAGLGVRQRPWQHELVLPTLQPPLVSCLARGHADWLWLQTCSQGGRVMISGQMKAVQVAAGPCDCMPSPDPPNESSILRSPPPSSSSLTLCLLYYVNCAPSFVPLVATSSRKPAANRTKQGIR